MMFQFFLMLLLIMAAPVRAEFIYPLDFKDTPVQRQEVMDWINSSVRETYCGGQIEMCEDAVIEMMKKKEIASFLDLTTVTNQTKLDRVIKRYCSGPVDMCSYATIEMIYHQDLDIYISKQDAGN